MVTDCSENLMVTQSVHAWVLIGQEKFTDGYMERILAAECQLKVRRDGGALMLLTTGEEQQGKGEKDIIIIT